MNNVLELKGKRFVQAAKNVSGGSPSMNSKETVTSEKINRLMSKLCQIREFWLHEKRPFSGVIVSIYYNKIVAKSNRVAGIFKGKDSNYAIVGAKFNAEKTKHIITYFLSVEDLENSIEQLKIANQVLKHTFGEGITKKYLMIMNNLIKSILKIVH